MIKLTVVMQNTAFPAQTAYTNFVGTAREVEPFGCSLQDISEELSLRSYGTKNVLAADAFGGIDRIHIVNLHEHIP